MENDITYLGQIIRVDSNTVEVEVSGQIRSYSPIINGKVYKVGQIGTFVKIPTGNIVTYGIVESVSNTPSSDNNTPMDAQKSGSRYLSINLVGEKVGDNHFEKGISLYPTIYDEVHIVTETDLEEIYGGNEKGLISIGKHSSSDNLDVYVDLHRLILRHSAILGSTGSGKSNSVVAILKNIISQYPNSRIVLVDPHGEYGSAFPDANILRINDKDNPLYIPFWLMNFEELAFFLVGAKPSDDQRTEYRLLREQITTMKKANIHLKAGAVNSDFITADSPIPFNVRTLWHTMNWWLNATFDVSTKDKQNATTARQISDGDPDTLQGATFEAHAAGSAAPYKSQHQEYYSYEKKLLSRLKDSRYDFLFNPGDYANETSACDLHHLLQRWIGGSKRLTILDLSNVPFEVMDITIGLITRFIYDSMFWGRNEEYTGKNRPLLLAYEEAHTYLGKSGNTNYARAAIERIFKEGRKFGLGSMVISQRPSEISETVLAQVGTFFALRLTNSSDQSIVKSLAPDNMNSLINLLPSLRIGEAVVVGEAIRIPSRIKLPLQKPQPDSADPKLVDMWSKNFTNNEDDYKSVVTRLREKKFK